MEYDNLGLPAEATPLALGGWVAAFSQGRFAMAVPHAKSGEVIDVCPLGAALAQAKTTTLVKTPTLEVVRLVIPAGKRLPVYQVQHEITIQCLEGRIALTAGDATHDLEAGQILYLAGGTPHSLRGVEDASALLSVLLR
jgi:quercetin dioxygenase-like cupin family protein